jgi:hypothetical protein
MDIQKERERDATSEKEELQVIDSTEKDGDKMSTSTESSLSEKREMTLAPLTQWREGEASAGKSTGPKTQRGKEVSRCNGLKHGIFSQVILVKRAQQAEYDSLLSGLRIDLNPVGTLEELLVDKLAAIIWRYRLLIIAQMKVSKKRAEWFLDECGQPQLELLLRYESALERSFDRTLNQLKRLQQIRLGEAIALAPNVDLST